MIKNPVHTVWIGAGTNLGDRRANLIHALDLIPGPGCRIKSISSVYESEAWGFESENFFYNQCLVIETDEPAGALLDRLKGIEAGMGRLRGAGKYSDRIIDLDILYYDDLILNSGDLKIPHPRLRERLFVLLPLAEISPGKLDPLMQLSVKELADRCFDTVKVKRLS